MTKSAILSTLRQQKIVAVLRGNDKEEGYRAAEACIKGGIFAIEVAYTNSQASDIIADLKTNYADHPHICIGAGTVLDAETARCAIMAGAAYIVSPAFNADTAKLCNRYGIPYLPGCMTLTEIVTALEAGCDIVKLFPGSALSPQFISAVKAPLPQAGLMVTGGVNLANAKEWLASGADAIGIGGEFNKLSAKGDFASITQMAQEYVALIH